MSIFDELIGKSLVFKTQLIAKIMRIKSKMLDAYCKMYEIKNAKTHILLHLVFNALVMFSFSRGTSHPFHAYTDGYLYK